MKKTFISLGLVLIMLLSCTCIAGATSYTSKLSISSYSTLKGSTRDYQGSNHKILIKLTSRAYDVPDNACEIYLMKSGRKGGEINREKLYLNKVGNSYSMSSKGVKDGAYYYFFDNQNCHGDGWTSDSVTMSSKYYL